HGQGSARRDAGAGPHPVLEEPLAGDDHRARAGRGRFREAGQALVQAVRNQTGRRSGRGEGKDLPHRPSRLLRRFRHAGGDRGDRAWPARSRRQDPARGRPRRRPAFLRRRALMRILIADDLSPEAKTILERIPDAQVDVRVGLKPGELREIAGAYDALAVRSATKVTAEFLAAATRLRVIGRAGTGVDNIDLDAATRGVELVSLAEIFRRSDAVTLHVPLNEQTKNMVAAPQLAQMKPGALLINCARGGLVDEMALAEALESKRLGGAALDVFETEPPPASHPLFSCE